MKCWYGCGQEATYQFKNGKWCCGEKWQSCPARREMRSREHKGKKHSKPKFVSNSTCLCDYGCGKIGHYQFKIGKWCCEDNQSKCPGIKEDISKKIVQLRADPESIYNSDEFRKLLSEIHTGQKYSDEARENKRKSMNVHYQKMTREERAEKYGRFRTVKMLQEKHPFFCVVEEIREHPETGEIQVRCKNHNCKNSKEKHGWFIPTNRQIEFRLSSLEITGVDNSYFYCCDECKEECPLFGLRPDIDPITKHVSENLYTAEEYGIFRQEVLKRQREELGCNECEYCGNRNVNELVVHHEKPQKTHPLLALDPDNGIVACGATSVNKCHYKYGHKTGTKCSTGKLASLICY